MLPTGVQVLHGLAPSYISNFCTRVQLSDRRASLCSATRSHYKLVIPRSSKFDERSFTVPSHQSGTLSHITSCQPHLLTLSKIDLKLICLVCGIHSAPDCFIKRLCFLTFPCLRRYINCHSYYYYLLLLFCTKIFNFLKC